MDDLELARRAAEAGAQVVRDWMGRLERADFKGEVDPVTEADRRSQQAILDLLRRHRPDDALLAEEEDVAGAPEGRRWIVDPLDGTVNFLHEIPHVAVAIALYEDERALLGVVLDVFRGECFTATAGRGCDLDGRPIRVTGRDRLSGSMIATGFPYDRHRHAVEYAATLGAVLAEARGIRRMGTAALDLAWVAAGRYDGFWEFKLAPWDVAAGILLVREAGGRVTDHEGRDVRPGDQVVVATNGQIHDQLRRLVAEHLPAHMAG